jgi:peptidyl-prolyl cis-trans isomerase A (cyclophilin A)
MDTVESLYAEFGEGAPRGRGPDQGRMQDEGEEYLARDFDALDRVIRARILDP